MPTVSPVQTDAKPASIGPAMVLVPPGGAFAHVPSGRARACLHQLPSLTSVQLHALGGSRGTTQSPGPGPTFLPTTGDMSPTESFAAVLASGAPDLPGHAWAGWVSYGMSAAIEPGVLDPEADPTAPLAVLHRVNLTRPEEPSSQPQETLPCRPVLRSNPGRAGYTRAVRRALEYIRAGDIYQANIAHQLSGRFSGSVSALFARLAGTARPAHGLGVVSPVASPDDSAPRALAVLSLSPELFLSYDATTRRLTTRPMKGTRPGNADPHELRDAPKDRAELAMIVDLMRNDLGRVCEFGSVRVDDPRRIERHASGPGAVLQATATVSGTVREGLGTADILAATFPPGSVTGTPKLRAMQIIDELEPFARGPWCGCLGVFGDDGSFELAVAIRTLVIQGHVQPGTETFADAEITYCVGAGIVADSDPESEWLETLDKARVLEPVFDIRTG